MEQIKITKASLFGKKRVAAILSALHASNISYLLSSSTELTFDANTQQGQVWFSISLSIKGMPVGTLDAPSVPTKWDIHTGWQNSTRDEALTSFLQELNLLKG